jgi:hypothetical protein
MAMSSSPIIDRIAVIGSAGFAGARGRAGGVLQPAQRPFSAKQAA